MGADAGGRIGADAVAQVRLLGSFSVRRNGHDLDLAGVATRLVIAALATSDNATCSDDRLARVLWGDGERSPSALRVAVTRARRAIEPADLAVERTVHGYRLAGRFQTDVAAVDADVRALRSVLDPVEREGIVCGALARWRGPAVADLRLCEGGEELARPLDARRTRLRTELYDIATSRGSIGRHLEEFVCWHDEDELDEGACCAAAAALHEVGRSTAALRRIQRTRRALAEVGLVVSEHVLDLERRCLAGGGPTTPESGRLLPAVQVRRAEGFVGREDVLDALTREWAVAGSGRSHVVAVSGVAGVGKTAAVAEFLARRVSAAIACCWWSGDPDVAEPLGPIREFIAELGGSVPDPDFGLVLDDSSPAIRRVLVTRAMDALATVLTTCPAVLVIDDVQWVDELTLAVVDRLVRRPLPVPCLVVLTIRQGFELVRLEPRIPLLQLDPLGHGELEDWLDGTGLDIDLVLRRTGGSPLLVRSLLRNVDTPVEVQGVRLLSEYFHALPDAWRDVVSSAAVLGGGARVGDVVRLAGVDTEDVVDALDAAVRRGVLRHRADRIWFEHAALRDAALNGLGPVRAQWLNARVVDVLGDGLSVDRRWIHSSRSGSLLAVGTYAASARAAIGANKAAATYETALRIATEAIDRRGSEMTPTSSAELMAEARAAATALGAVDVAAQWRTRLQDLADNSRDPGAQIIAFVDVTSTGRRWTADLGRVDVAVSLLPSVDQVSPEWRIGFLRAMQTEMVFCDAEESWTSHRDTMCNLLRADGEPGRRALCGLELRAAFTWGTPEDRRDAIARQDLNDPQVEATVCDYRLLECIHDNDLPAALEVIGRQDALSRSGRHPYNHWLTSAVRATVASNDADLDLAERLSFEALEVGRLAGVEGATSAWAAQSFALAWFRGGLAAFEPSLVAAVDADGDPVWMAALALLRAAGGDRDSASTLLDTIVAEHAALAHGWLRTVSAAVAIEAASLCGRGDVAVRLAPCLERTARDHVLLGDAIIDYGPAERYLALAELVTDETEGLARLSAVATSPRSGRLWAMRAAADIARHRGEPISQGPWSWLSTLCDASPS